MSQSLKKIELNFVSNFLSAYQQVWGWSYLLLWYLAMLRLSAGPLVQKAGKMLLNILKYKMFSFLLQSLNLSCCSLFATCCHSK